MATAPSCRRLVASLLAALLGAAGCPKPGVEPVSKTTTVAPDDDGRRACADPPKAARRLTVPVRLALAPSVDRAQATAILAQAASTLQLAGLEVSVGWPSLTLREGPAVLAAPAPSTTAADELRTFARASLKPLVDLARAHPADGPIVVAIVPRLFSRRAKVQRFVRGDVDGLTLGGRARAPSKLDDALALPPHPPIVAIEAGEMAGDTLAHELGHALGLEHTDDANNLMHAGKRPGCLRVITAEQRAHIDKALEPAQQKASK